MRYLKFGNSTKTFFLVEQEVKTAEKVKETSLNNFFLYDESGSMCNSIDLLCSQLKKKIQELPLKDTVTLGWFSGEGQYRFIVKGHKLTCANDYAALEKIIDQNCMVRGCTCFSEILMDLNEVVAEVELLNPQQNSLIFFTDGYPVVSNYTKEIESIIHAINRVSSKFNSILLVGYGDYYNKTLMSSMADQFGGSLIHNGDLAEFSNKLQTFWDDARENGDRVNVDLDFDSANVIFGLNGNQVTCYKPLLDGSIMFTPAKKGKSFVYGLVQTEPEGKELVLSDAKVKSSDSLVKGAYALAYILTQSTKTDLALEVLASVGDIALIELVTNSYTNAEYGFAESFILSNITAPSKRFAKGRDISYLPPVNAFCLKNAVDLLMEDEKAFFYPTDARFEYKRIGKKDVPKEGYPEFIKSKDCKSELHKLTYHDKRLNLSILVKIDGSIKLDDQATAMGFSEIYPTYIWRSYAVVKDGILNIKTLPISMSKETFDILQSQKCIPLCYTWKENEIYSVDLSTIPIMNRKIAEGNTSAKVIAEKALREVSLEGELKVLKYYKAKYYKEEKFASSVLIPAQKVYLERQGITTNGFNPPSVEEPAIDFYEAKEFEIKLKGLAKLPKVDEVIKKMEEGKSLTNVFKLMSGAITHCNVLEKSLHPEVLVKQLEVEIKQKTKELSEIRKFIQGTKFAILLGKKWFEEFTSREEAVLEVEHPELGNIEVTFSLKTAKVEY